MQLRDVCPVRHKDVQAGSDYQRSANKQGTHFGLDTIDPKNVRFLCFLFVGSVNEKRILTITAVILRHQIMTRKTISAQTTF
jgi:hypothetical protein